NDKNLYKVRFVVTDKFDRKQQDETPLAIIKPGTITAIFEYAQIAKDAGKDKASRSGIKVKAKAMGVPEAEGTTAGDGKAKIGDIAPGEYKGTATLSEDLGKEYELLTTRKDADELKEGQNVDVNFEIDPLSTLKVTLKSGDKSLKDATIKLNGKVIENKNIFGDDGTIDFGVMPPDRYTIEITYPDDHALWDTYHAPETITVDLLRGHQLKQDVPA